MLNRFATACGKIFHFLISKRFYYQLGHRCGNACSLCCALGFIVDSQGESSSDHSLQSTTGGNVWKKKQGWRALPGFNQRGKWHHQADHLWRSAERQRSCQQGWTVTEITSCQPRRILSNCNHFFRLLSPGHRRRVWRRWVPKCRANFSRHSEYPRHEGISEETQRYRLPQCGGISLAFQSRVYTLAWTRKGTFLFLLWNDPTFGVNFRMDFLLFSFLCERSWFCQERYKWLTKFLTETQWWSTAATDGIERPNSPLWQCCCWTATTAPSKDSRLVFELSWVVNHKTKPGAN